MNNAIELLAYTLFIMGIVAVIFAFSLRRFMSKDTKQK
jgi:hypothetical protein